MQAAAGYTRYLGVHGRPSIRLGADVAGTVTGIFVLQAVLAALLFRERGGAGQTVSVSQLNSLLSMKSIHLAAQSDPDEYAGPRVGGANHPPEFGWRTADFPITFSFGGSVGETGRAGWKEFVREIGLGWMLTDERFTDDPSGRSTTGHGLRAGELKPEYEKEFVKHPASEIVEMVRRHGGAAAVYQDHTAVVQHEQTVTMGVVGRAGDSGRRFTKFPARFSRLSPRMLENVPGFASDTRTIAHELGFTDHEVDTMVAGGGLVCA
jgi:crotonobetainyl-CoA:carnitine CoA-transferase CaiB-like acyl-CoA transferase